MVEDFFRLLDAEGIQLNNRQINLFEQYYKILIEWNQKMNLTSIVDKSDVYLKHFYDSICIVLATRINKQSILDVGSGAGFPGIPLKIVFPFINLTIIESQKKRVNFLNYLVESLNLDVRIVQERIEKHKCRQYYDIVTARAVASMPILAELCIPFVKLGGLFLPLKSANIKEEINQSENAIHLLGAKLDGIIEYNYVENERSIPKFVKIRSTDKRYPRSYHKIKQQPL